MLSKIEHYTHNSLLSTRPSNYLLETSIIDKHIYLQIEFSILFFHDGVYNNST